MNTEGGFVCECGPGMQLSADRHSCQGERLGGQEAAAGPALTGWPRRPPGPGYGDRARKKRPASSGSAWWGAKPRGWDGGRCGGPPGEEAPPS